MRGAAIVLATLTAACFAQMTQKPTETTAATPVTDTTTEFIENVTWTSESWYETSKTTTFLPRTTVLDARTSVLPVRMSGGTVWPVKLSAEVAGDVILGGLMMVHEREDSIVCGPIMPQGGVQALETMLYTLDVVNNAGLLPNFSLGAHILDDCDKDTYGLEMAVDFIKGKFLVFL